MLDVGLEEVALAGGPAVVARPADWPVLREQEDERGRSAPYWAIVWPSGEALADELTAAPPPPGARVLELGCGLALPSLAAAREGAEVLATDGSAEAVAFAAHTLALGEQRGEVAVVDWREPRLLVERGPWDLVVAADVLYLQANVRVLAELLPQLGPQAWIADPGRAGAGDFLEAVAPAFEVSSGPAARDAGVAVHRLSARPA
jgi:predicted nicotinamide N-methyase